MNELKSKNKETFFNILYINLSICYFYIDNIFSNC